MGGFPTSVPSLGDYTAGHGRASMRGHGLDRGTQHQSRVTAFRQRGTNASSARVWLSSAAHAELTVAVERWALPVSAACGFGKDRPAGPDRQ